MSGGNGYTAILTFTRPPERVVSLVPSLTESLFDLGAGQYLAGVTDYCRPPAEAEGRLRRVGGTRNPDVEAIRALKPELVIANKEENSRRTVESLEAGGIKVWVTFPRSVDEALSLLWALVRLFNVPASGNRIRTLEVALEWERRAASQRTPVRVFAPIWQGTTETGQTWWMTFNRDTYAHDVLSHCGGENVFAGRERRYPMDADLGLAPPEEPGDRDTRYPRVMLAEVIEASPELILLPDEPYAFGEREEAIVRELLAETPAVQADRVRRIDGSLLTWHGTRLARSLAELPAVLQSASS
ncbi:MAG: helical backbone metal receptor [Chloroflexota bacterium]